MLRPAGFPRCARHAPSDRRACAATYFFPFGPSPCFVFVGSLFTLKISALMFLVCVGLTGIRQAVLLQTLPLITG